ncbi:MAG: glucose-6-phosphate isomerase, partial [Pseudomonadota bacterium]
AVSNHIALVTSRPDRAREWLGTSDVTTFDLPESVGGRFSIWSNGSLALRIALGPEIIDQFREGAAEMDAHFETEPLETNLPVRLALIDYWNRNALAASMRVLLAYSRRLRLLPAYLQQLEMESNGKSVSPEGKPLPGATAPALWGGEGSVGQHSYHQWLHQGTEAVPTEFILATDPKTDLAGRTALTAHALAQAEVLANGRVIEEVQAEESDLTAEIAAQKVHAGNRPSTFLYTQDFGPASLGALIALFEHRVFISGKLWQINSFDQWGVERGKTMAGKIKQVLTTAQTADDPITANLSHDLKLG